MSAVTIFFDSRRQESVRRRVADIKDGTYFIGALVNVASRPDGFGAIENNGVFYKTSSGITFLEASSIEPYRSSFHGGRFWANDENQTIEAPAGGSYVDDYFEVDVAITFTEKL